MVKMNGKPKSYKRAVATSGQGPSNPSKAGSSKGHTNRDGSNAASKSFPRSKASGASGQYAKGKGKAYMSQGGENEVSAINRGRRRTNKGKNHTTAGFQGMRGG